MTPYFPLNTQEWKFEEPAAFRKFSMSVWEMAIVTGVLLRLYRALAMTTGPTGNWMYFGATFLLGMLWLLGMATLHLGNFPLRQWFKRAPAFALIETAAESLTSLGLILAKREPMGSARAQLHDWVEISGRILLWRMVSIILFAFLLAGVVQFVRYLLLRKENRVHTAVAVHEEMAKQEVARHRE